MQTVKQRLYAGERVFGTFVMEFNTPGIAAILQAAGAAFAVYDQEHSGFGTDALRQILSYNRGLPLVPLVRVPDTRYDFMARALDAGAKGIMVPLVESADQAREIVRACKYPPHGARGTATNIAHDNFAGGADLADALGAANNETLLIAQIETEAGVNAVDEILAVEGIDVVWVGHNDLSVSLGLPGQVNHPRVVQALEQVAGAAARAGKTAGRLVPDLDTARRSLAQGYRFLAYSNDIRLLQSALAPAMKALESGE